MEFSRQEYWSGLLCPPPGDLPDPGIEPVSPALQTDYHWATREAAACVYIPWPCVSFLVQEHLCTVTVGIPSGNRNCPVCRTHCNYDQILDIWLSFESRKCLLCSVFALFNICWMNTNLTSSPNGPCCFLHALGLLSQSGELGWKHDRTPQQLQASYKRYRYVKAICKCYEWSIIGIHKYTLWLCWAC